MNLAILASGRGSNFTALVKAVQKGRIKARIKLLICDKSKAFVRKRARKLGIKECLVEPKYFKSRLDFDKKLVKILRSEKINLVILAGYMRILTPYFVKSFKNKILNIHPAILPDFKGANSIKRAFDCGCKLTGVTVHFVDEKVDHGPIILQESIALKKGMSLGKLEQRMHKLEHKLYPLAVKLFVDKRLKVKKRKVEII